MTDAGVPGSVGEGRSGVIAAVLLFGLVVVAAAVVAPVPVGASGAEEVSVLADGCDRVDQRGRQDGTLAVTGCLTEGQSATVTYEVPADGAQVVVAMRGPSGADYDLYVTRDGRTPTADDHGLASQGPGAAERVAVPDASGEIAVTVRATRGQGQYVLRVRSNESGGTRSTAAAFTTRPRSPSVGQAVQLAADTSVAGPDAEYTWKFDDGTAATGAVVNHTFQSVGTHRVRLTVTGPSGTDSVTRTVNVTGATTEPRAQFSVSPGQASTGQSITFDASGSSAAGEVAYVWQFDDGTTARGKVVEHTFATGRPHQVRLAVVTKTGSDTAVRTVTVTGGDREIVPRLAVETRDDDRVVYVGEAVRFSGAATTATDGVARYGFEFGDGDTSYGTSARVAHRYDEPGTYTVTMHVTDADGDRRSISREIRVVETRVAITEVTGLQDPVFEPIGLFANCGEVGTVRVRTGGSEPVERVEFTVRGKTFVDKTPGDGWTMPRGRFPTPGRVIKVTAVTESGRTDTVTAPVQLADAPDGVVGYLINANYLIKGYNHINGEAGDVPAEVGNCELTITWPTWSNDVSGTFETDGNYTLPGTTTEFIEPPSKAVFATQFRLRYRPGQNQVTVGGAGSSQLIMPPKETNLATGVSVNGVYTVPEWNLSTVAFGGQIDGNYHLEDWLVPLPSTEISLDLDGPDGPMPGASVGLPLDLIFGPELRLTGNVGPSFEPDTVNARFQGELSLRGQAGGRIAAIDTPFGEYELKTGSAWAEGALQTDRLQVVPFQPTIAGRFFVNYGVKVDVPFVPNSVMEPYTWERTREWDLEPSIQGGAGAGMGPGTAAAVRMSAGQQVETTAGHSSEPHRSSASPGEMAGQGAVAATGTDGAVTGSDAGTAAASAGTTDDGDVTTADPEPLRAA